MQKGPHQPQGMQRGNAQQHIAQLTDGGVGQPLFEAVFFIGQQRTHEHRKQNHAHKGDLHPGALQEGSAHKLEHQPHHTQHTALGDDAGQHSRSRRGSGGMRRGQPAVQGIQTALGPKPQQHQEDHGENKPFMPGGFFHVQHTACGEGKGVRIGAQQENAQQHQGCTGHGINEILDTGGYRIFFAGVHHHGNGEQGHELVEHVEGGQAAGKAYCHQHPQGA